MTWDQDLTGKALAIAATDCRYLRVMAGPGTGKTFAMKRRVARLLEEGSNPEHLLVVTFTRVAAAGLVDCAVDRDERASFKAHASHR